MMTTIFTFVILLSVLILVHEAGHFLAAKRAGVRVEEFGLGLPPRVWGKQIGETIYSINWLPIGGFVRLTGEEGEEKNKKQGQHFQDFRSEIDSRSFANQGNLTKATIISAGVIMNFLLGVLLIGVVFGFLGVPQISNVVEIKEVLKDSPAAKAGVEVGDFVLQYGGQEVRGSKEFVGFIETHLGEEIILKIEREEKVVCVRAPCPPEKIWTDITITPRMDPPEGQGPLGIVFMVIPSISYQQIPVYRVPDTAFTESIKLTEMLFTGVLRVFKDWVITKQAPQDIAGPVGIARITNEVVKQGLFPVLNFAALLSINLAVINILPFPGLDGGRLTFVAIEAILRRKISAHYQKWVHTLGIALLLLFMLLITFYDIVKWL